MNNMRKKRISGFSLPAWGEPDVPLLPESLRSAWAGELLPPWVLRETGLPEGSSLASLDSRVWAYALKTLNPQLRNFLVNLVHSRRREIEPLAVFLQPWPVSLSPHQLRWATRTWNCLERSGLLGDRLALSRLTYKELFKIPAMGAISVLDFASTAEAAMAQLSIEGDASQASFDFEPVNSDVQPQDTPRRDMRDRLLTVIDTSWATQVSEQDPRFVDLLPPGDGTIFERIDEFTSTPADNRLDEQLLAEAIPAIEARIHEIDRLPLDVALKDFLFAVSRYSGKKQEALLARLGWSGREPITLEEAGYIAGLSRERVRQLLKRIEDRMPKHPIFMPALDKAINVLAVQAPIDAEQAAQLLVTEGISLQPFSPLSVLEVAKAGGREAPFEIEEHRGRSIIMTSSHAKHANAILSIAYRQAMTSGATNVGEVMAEALSRGISIGEAAIRDMLRLLPDVRFLEDDWFWYPKGKKGGNPLWNKTRRMLSVVSLMSIATIREGLRREYRYRNIIKARIWDLAIPPRSVLRAFFRMHPEFEIDEFDQITPIAPLDYRIELSATEQIFVDVFRSSPACVLDRASCAKACIERGMNQHTFSVYLTYSAVIAHLGTDIWTLRGVQVDPATVEALRATNAERAREKRVLDYGWTPNGRLWVAVRLPELKSLAAFTFGMPAPIRRLVADREFPASSESGILSGVVRVNADGISWGYGSFLGRSGADEDDILIVEFDLAEGTAILRLGDDEVLDKLNP